MKQIKLSLFIWILLITIDASAESSYVLGLGESIQFPIDPSTPIRITSPKNIQVIDGGKRLTLVGKKIGTSLILTEHQSLQIEVVSRQLALAHKDFLFSLKKMKGLKLSFKENKFYVTGELLRWRDWTELAEVARSNQVNWAMQAQVASNIQVQVKKQIQGELKKHGLDSNSLFMEPTVHLPLSESEFKMMESSQWIKTFGLQLESHPVTFEKKPLVRVQFHFIELQKNSHKQLGFEWDSLFSFRVAPNWNPPSDLISRLQALETNGVSHFLAQPQILVSSGDEGEMLMGGEIPIPSAKGRVRELTWKKHGLWFKVTPHVHLDQSIALKLESEVSVPDPSIMVEGIPGLRSNKTKSKFYSQNKGTVLLMSLDLSHFGKSTLGSPFVKEVPLFGALFKSDSFLNQESKLFVFATLNIEPSLTPQLHTNPPIHSQMEL